MLILVLSNDMEIEVLDGSTIFDIMVNPSQYNYMWTQLAQEKLKLVKLVTQSGVLLDQKENLVVNSENSFWNKESIECHFYLREKTREELLEEEVASLKEQLAVHDGAIGDIAQAVSGLAEEGGLT